MNLEERVVSWVDLGLTYVDEVRKLQEELVELREDGKIGDVILATQHYPVITFGSTERDNLFSDEFLQEVISKRGVHYTEGDIIELLREKGIGFVRSNRGGGAGAVSPGQYLYYPIVNFPEIVGKKDIGIYKSKIYRIMFNSLRDLGIEGVNTGSQEEFETRRERKDAWINRDGRVLKMGSKALRYKGNVVYYGFSLFIKREGNANGWMVNTCGYHPSEVEIGSVEEELEGYVPENVHDIVQNNFLQNFDYCKINEVGFEDLKNMIRDSKIKEIIVR